MKKLVLFASKDTWGLPEDVNLQKSFAGTGHEFGDKHLVLFAATELKGAENKMAASAPIAIAWEPPHGRSYEDDQLERIRDGLTPFMATAGACGIVLHRHSERDTWSAQRELISSLRSNCPETLYSKGHYPPYTLFCSAIDSAGANLAAFEHHLAELVRYIFGSRPPPKALSLEDDLKARLGDAGWLHSLKSAKALVRLAIEDLAPDQPRVKREEQWEIIRGRPSDFIERSMQRLAELLTHPFVQTDAFIERQLAAANDRLSEANLTWLAVKDAAQNKFANQGADWMFKQVSLLASLIDTVESNISELIHGIDTRVGR